MATNIDDDSDIEIDNKVIERVHRFTLGDNLNLARTTKLQKTVVTFVLHGHGSVYSIFENQGYRSGTLGVQFVSPSRM